MGNLSQAFRDFASRGNVVVDLAVGVIIGAAQAGPPRNEVPLEEIRDLLKNVARDLAAPRVTG